jgi:hypothetical protein
MLAEGEIGLLMHDTTAKDAKVIAERLRAVVGSSPDSGPILVGVASRGPGNGHVDGLVRAARADALRGEAPATKSASFNEVRS